MGPVRNSENVIFNYEGRGVLVSKASAEAKQKRRWFFKVENVSDAEEAMKACYQTFYAIAALQAAILVTLHYLGKNVGIATVIDPVAAFALAWFVHYKKSRTAAVLLGMYALGCTLITLGNRAGVNTGDEVGGRNLLLAVLAIYAAYKGLQGTFKYHSLTGTRIVGKNIVKMSALWVLYNVAAISLIIIALAETELRYGRFPEDVVGGALILCILIISAGTAFRILPWTRNKPLTVIEEGSVCPVSRLQSPIRERERGSDAS